MREREILSRGSGNPLRITILDGLVSKDLRIMEGSDWSAAATRDLAVQPPAQNRSSYYHIDSRRSLYAQFSESTNPSNRNNASQSTLIRRQKEFVVLMAVFRTRGSTKEIRSSTSGTFKTCIAHRNYEQYLLSVDANILINLNSFLIKFNVNYNLCLHLKCKCSKSEQNNFEMTVRPLKPLWRNGK